MKITLVLDFFLRLSMSGILFLCGTKDDLKVLIFTL